MPALALRVVEQADFSAGAFPANERVPANGVEQLVNGFYADDGTIYKRGGGANKSNADSSDIIEMLWDGRLLAGARTVWSEDLDLTTLASNDATPEAVVTFVDNTDSRLVRPAAVAGILALNGRQFYGGSRKATYSTGTVQATNGSLILTGVGTTFTGNVESGMIVSSAGYRAIVESVISNTQINLLYPWSNPDLPATAYTISKTDEIAWNFLNTTDTTLVASVGGRLAIAHGNRIDFSVVGQPFNFQADDYHKTQDGATITGLQGVGDSLLVFSESGMSVVRNMSYDLTDALGNVQQTMTQDGRQLILWHNNGIAEWRGATVIPGIDDVYLYAGGQLSEPVSRPFRNLYRRYVSDGYSLGIATVYRDHYLLPILLDGSWVTTLACRLDTRAWSVLDGVDSECLSFATRTTGATPELYGAKTLRIVDTTGFFDPNSLNKADSTGLEPTWECTLRTQIPRQGVPTHVRWVRVRAELDDAGGDNPTITAEWAPGRPGSSYTSLTGSMVESPGTTPKKWRVEQRAIEGRLRLTSVGPSSKLVLRSVETAYRQSGRQ